ncbi:MAG: low molecular weight protein arginine phosphatase [Clostridiales bacterium]|nr:low molecular weight protein arginine phosphatase [Clostridiales bacterium]
MAEGILRYVLSKNGRLNEFSVSSAGVFADGISKASINAVSVLKDEWGIDIGDHVSRQLQEEDLRVADVVLVMTKLHKKIILSLYKEYENKVFTLSEDNDIVDPYGGTYDVYKICAKKIKDSIDIFLERHYKQGGD